MTYNDYVIRSILANNPFGIKAVNDLESFKSIYFVKEEYTGIERLIKQNDIKALLSITQSGIVSEDYLDLMSFNDQNGKGYVVTVYDSNFLEQDPQIIEIYSR